MNVVRFIGGRLEDRDVRLEAPRGKDRKALEDWLAELGVGPVELELVGPAGSVQLRGGGVGAVVADPLAVSCAVVIELAGRPTAVFCQGPAEALEVAARLAPMLQLTPKGGSHA